MGIILDTSVLIEAERGRLKVEDLAHGREDEPFGLSVITVSELLHGVMGIQTKADREKFTPLRQSLVRLAGEVGELIDSFLSNLR